MDRDTNVAVTEKEEVLFESKLFDIAVTPEGWDPESADNKCWGEDDLEVERVEVAVVVTEESEVVVRLANGREHSYKRAIERAELGDNYVIPGGEWMVLISNGLPERAAEAMGMSYREGVNEEAGTDVRLVEA